MGDNSLQTSVIIVGILGYIAKKYQKTRELSDDCELSNKVKLNRIYFYFQKGIQGELGDDDKLLFLALASLHATCL